MGLIEVREALADVVRDAAALPCACSPDHPCLACRAAAVLEDITARGIRLRRWRNEAGAVHVVIVHVAGPVMACREYRRSCPGYIVDRRQTCAECGTQLVRGRWAAFFDVGELVGVLGADTRAPTATYARGRPGEVRCSDLPISTLIGGVVHSGESSEPAPANT